MYHNALARNEYVSLYNIKMLIVLILLIFKSTFVQDKSVGPLCGVDVGENGVHLKYD